MTDNNFQHYGRALLTNGYLIIPIKPGHKRPALDNWQTARLGVTELPRYPDHGVGVLCGQGAQPIAAIDVDTTDAGLSERFVEWCQQHLGVTCERIGNAPKILLCYRAEQEGWGKATGAWFADSADARHRLEVLGKGQQFVAYHIHPDTGEPYEWVDLFGGIAAVRASDLPVVTEAQIAEALQVFEQFAEEAGLVRVKGSTSKAVSVTATLDDDPLMSYEPPLGIDLAKAKALLGFIDNEDYDTWLKVGMSLHHEFDGSDDALALWDTWSSTARNYASSDDLARRWQGFGGSGKPTTARWLLKVGNQGKRDAIKADKRSALDETKALIVACRDSIDLVNDIARRAGEAAGDDLALRAELAGLIRARFKELTDTSLPVADVRAAMAGGTTRKVVPFKQQRGNTEFGNAERMLDHYGTGLMFVPEIEAWFGWTGVYWRRAANVELEHLAKETIRALPDEAKTIESDAARADFFKFCAISQRAAMVRNIVSLAQSDPRVVVSVTELDKQPYLLGVSNGVADLRTGKLLPPDPTHRVTTITAADYNPDAQAPLFEETLRDVFYDDVTMIEFFQRLIGYALLAQPTEDVLVIPYGTGSNGKSTVLGAIREVLGGYARTADSSTFLTTNTNGGNAGAPREDVLRLRGARFVYVTEPDEGSELREGLIKAMTGGEPLPARGIHAKTTVEVAPTWVTFMPTNHRPIVKGDDHAIWRRLLTVPFTRNFDQDLTLIKDPDRADKLRLEAEGILAWCVRGALAYQQHGLKPPSAVRKSREDYRNDMDLLAEWLDECCELRADYVESNARLWSSWEAFARARGELRFIASVKSLGRRLESRGFAAIKDTGGIRGKGRAGLQVRRSGDFE